VRQEHDSQVQKLREALRRTEREAILLRHQLSRTSNQSSGNTVSLSNAPVVTPPTTTNNAPPRPASSLPNDSTSPSLAAHLLQTCPEEPPSLLIAAANNPSSSENNLSLVWLLSEHCLLHDTGWIWLKEALTWSATSRRLVRGSCHPRTSRISCHTLSYSQLEQAAQSLRQPLECDVSSSAVDRPYLVDLRQRLLDKLTCLEHLDIMAVLLSDASREECALIGWQPLCAFLEAPIPKILKQSVETWLVDIRGLRSWRKVPSTSLDTDPPRLPLVRASLQVMRQCWSYDNTSQEWAQTMLRYLLDLLEYWVLPNIIREFDFGCDILRILTRWCQSPLGFVGICTQYPLTDNRWACTGVGICVQLWNSCLMTGDHSNMSLTEECIRLLHLVLQHVQRQRSESLPSCSFRSLVSEYP
jgi:hypothetical protein